MGIDFVVDHHYGAIGTVAGTKSSAEIYLSIIFQAVSFQKIFHSSDIGIVAAGKAGTADTNNDLVFTHKSPVKYVMSQDF